MGIPGGGSNSEPSSRPSHRIAHLRKASSGNGEIKSNFTKRFLLLLLLLDKSHSFSLVSWLCQAILHLIKKHYQPFSSSKESTCRSWDRQTTKSSPPQMTLESPALPLVYFGSMRQVPLERDINIAVKGCSGFATSTQKGPFMAMLISHSRGTYLIDNYCCK